MLERIRNISLVLSLLSAVTSVGFGLWIIWGDAFHQELGLKCFLSSALVFATFTCTGSLSLLGDSRHLALA